MLTNGMKESVSKEVVIEQIKKGAWEIVMQFLYTGKVKIEDEETCVDILCFAHLFEIDLLLRMAENQLIRYTSRENVIEKLLFGDKLGLKVLYNAAMKIIGVYFLTIHETEAFQALPFRIMDEILMRNDLFILSELDIAEAIIGWADKSASKKEGDPGSFSPWKNVQAQHLFNHMNYTRNPDLLVKLLNDMSFNPKRINCQLNRYAPELKTKRFTFLFKTYPFNVKSGQSVESPLYTCAKSKSKYKLEVARDLNTPETYTAKIEPPPANADKSEIFILRKRTRDKGDFQIQTVKQGFKVDIPTNEQYDMVVFGVNIFH